MRPAKDCHFHTLDQSNRSIYLVQGVLCGDRTKLRRLITSYGTHITCANKLTREAVGKMSIESLKAVAKASWVWLVRRGFVLGGCLLFSLGIPMVSGGTQL